MTNSKTTIIYYFNYLVGRFRLDLSMCPLCNSDAPEKDHCPICENHTTWPPDDKTKKEWWDRYLKTIKCSRTIKNMVKASKAKRENKTNAR